jgi:hypothetical protein
MFTLENITKLKGTLLALSLAILVTGCNETAQIQLQKMSRLLMVQLSIQ